MIQFDPLDVRDLWFHIGRARRAAGDEPGAKNAYWAGRMNTGRSKLIKRTAYRPKIKCRHPACGNSFIYNGNQVYCSSQCRLKDNFRTHLIIGHHTARCGSSGMWPRLGTVAAENVNCALCLLYMERDEERARKR